MKIGIVHGWLLDGSGSNIYVRSLAAAMAARGHEVHVVCQEPHPERFEAFDVAFRYGPDLAPEKVCGAAEGAALWLHVPYIDRDVMPVFNADTSYEGFDEVATFHEMQAAGDPRIARYLDQLTAGLTLVCEQHDLDLLHANHVYPMPEICRRVKQALAVPFLVYPHGSAIEYTIKQSAPLAAVAREAIDAADALVVGNDVVTDRIFKLYPDRAADWQRKHQIVSVGVDPEIFEPLPRDGRAGSVERLGDQDLPGGGKRSAQSRALLATAAPTRDDRALLDALDSARGAYEHKVPDGDVLDKLRAVDWANDKVIGYVGKLIVGKGLHDFVVALPAILEQHPRTTLLVIGEGPFREPLELLLHALSSGDRELFERLVRLGWGLDTFEPRPLDKIQAYVDQVGLDWLLELGRETRPADHVVFCGYLKHGLLRHVFPCADLAVFPSEIAEAYPLVLIESIAAGVLPLASYFEGLGDGLVVIGQALDPALAPLMRFEIDPACRVSSMLEHTSALLARRPDWRDRCRALAVQTYAWEAVAAKMEAVYLELASG